MEDKPSHVLRRGKDTSMWHTIQSVKDGAADVAVSAGNTGALMAVSMFGLGIIEGISRPAIARASGPPLRGQTIVLDVRRQRQRHRRTAGGFRGDGRSSTSPM